MIWACMLIIGTILINRPEPEGEDENGNCDASRTSGNSFVEDKSPVGMLNSSRNSQRMSLIPSSLEELQKVRCYDLKSPLGALHSVRFWHYFFMLLFGLIFCGIFMYEYKPIGLSVGISDFILSWAASISALTQAVTRLTAGYLYDKLGFKTIFLFLMLINTINSAISYEARNNETLYFACIQMNYLVLAGCFSLYPTAISNTFGPKCGA